MSLRTVLAISADVPAALRSTRAARAVWGGR